MAGATRDDVYKLIGYIESDLRAANAKFTELRSMLAAGAMNQAGGQEILCPRCKIAVGGERALAFHIQNVHDGPAVPLDEAELIA